MRACMLWLLFEATPSLCCPLIVSRGGGGKRRGGGEDKEWGSTRPAPQKCNHVNLYHRARTPCDPVTLTHDGPREVTYRQLTLGICMRCASERVFLPSVVGGLVHGSRQEGAVGKEAGLGFRRKGDFGMRMRVERVEEGRRGEGKRGKGR